MASTQDLQEELQKSVLLSEEDAKFEEDDMGDAMVVDDDAAADPNQSSNTYLSSNQVVSKSNGVAGGEMQSEKGLDRGNGHSGDDEGHDEPEEEDPADQDDNSEEEEDSDSHGGDAHDEDGEFEEDAEGEDDDMGAEIPPTEQHGVLSGGDEDGEENEEVVGAVKIKPGETDDEDESEIDDDASSASSVSSRGSGAEWEEEAAENDDNDDEEDEESEVADSSTCVFCKKDEENDPGEDFESFLSCKGCGEHAHQQCARDADALNEKNRAGNWKCLECAGDDSDSESDAVSVNEEAEVDGEVEDGDVSPASTRRSTASKIARDLLPSQRGVNKPDSHSVFNQLVLDEDPMDGSRVLRKRKTSSAEAEINEEVMSLRKRRKNTNDGSNQDEAVQEKPNGTDEGVRPRSSRSLRLKISNPEALCIFMEKSSKKLILKMRVPAAELRQILSQKPKTRKRSNRATTSRSARSTARARRTATAEPPPLPPMAPFSSSSYTQPFYSFYDKETDELKGKPYGGILTEAEADTSKTLPAKDDRRRFDEAKQKADEEWRNRLLEMQAEIEAPAKKSKKSSGPASQIECIEFGGWEIDTWYAAPYPEEYSRNRVLYICEFCLKYMNSDYVAWRHKLKCSIKHPPGDEIYRQGSISFFEVDGRKNPVYCQNLCLLAKLFLGSKTLYYDVEPFLFYVLCEYDDLGYHFVGYFSKEKRASSQNNVSCILTLPIHQRKGYGNLLIDFSYLLTRVEEKTGSPEKPLSDMGLVSYRNYWRLVMCKYLLEHTPTDKLQKKGMSIRQMSDDTGMMPDDVISALEGLRCLVRDPGTQQYAFRVDLPFCREYVAKWEVKNYVQLNEKALTWTPYVMGRSNATNFELGPALNAIAPRDEDEDNKAVQILAESGIATGDFAVTNDARQTVLAGDSTILESTEPNENALVTSKEETKINGIDKENDQPAEETTAQDSGENKAPTVSTEDAWMTCYKDIPPVRFEVFPPINPKRPGASRVNSTISRPVPSRPPVTVPRPRPKRPAGSGVRKAAARPKSTAARRKTGGTGRGPGRWPKGTKKEDYGGASSGPGLPPGWIKKQADAEAEKAAKPGAADNETKDTVEVKQSRSRKSSNKGTDSDTISARFALKEKDVFSSVGSNAGTGSGDVKANNGGNVVEGEGGYKDAEGEGD